MFPKIGVPQNGWFITENPIRIDDLGGKPLFLETPISVTAVCKIMDYVVILKVKFVQSGFPSPKKTCAFIRIVFCVESAAGISRTTPSAITRNISARLPAVFSCPSQTASEVYCVSTHWHTCLPTDTLMRLRSGVWLEANVSNCETVWWLSPQAGIMI